jgi:hypothetical protein
LKNVAGYGVASLASPAASLFARETEGLSYFGLHPFIEAHPEAVFIRKTRVPAKTDIDAKKQESLALARRIFTISGKPGIPLTGKIAIKPNLTSAKGSGLTHAIITDPYVVEGFVEGIKQASMPGANIYMREGLSVKQAGSGFIELAGRQLVHYEDDDSRTPTTKECQDGVVFRHTKYLGPFNYPDTFLINIAKMKSHSMGLTLCTKNLQGTNAQPYIRFCGGVQKNIAEAFQPDAEKHVEELYEKHLKAGLPRWDTEKGLWMEMWIQRTLDHYSLIRPTVGLNMIEAVYSQNGDGFDGGPGPDGLPESFMTNMLIFGKDAFRVDIIGHWLGGHEPGNFGLFHIARERGVSSALNPKNIPVYVWEDDGPRLSPLASLPRTPLSTLYLQKTGEARFHMIDEPFAYAPEPAAAAIAGGSRPRLEVLGMNRPAPAESSLILEYCLPREDFASLEVFNASGDKVAVLAKEKTGRGAHMAAWDTRRMPAGRYYCRFRASGIEEIRPLTVAG